MGTYRLMTRFWPEPRNPEIITTGGFPEFYVTATDQLFSRTIFLYYEVMQNELILCLVHTGQNILASLQIAYNYYFTPTPLN